MTSNANDPKRDIDRVGWHTRTPGNTESREHIEHRFRVIATYLQDRGLTVRPILAPGGTIDDDFAINAHDLTDEGMAIARAAYHKWLTKVDKGMPPDDVSLLDKALAKIRG